MRVFITIFILIYISSCQIDNSDLGNSYYYLDGYEAKDIGYSDGAVIYKSPYKLSFREIKVKREVIQVAHDDKFILAKQVSGEGNIDTNYFVIDKQTDKIFESISLDSLERLRKRLEIKTSL